MWAARLGGFCLAVLACAAVAQSPTSVLGERLGGAGSVVAFGNKAFAQPAANLTTSQLRDFFFGNRLFNTNWTVAPGSVAALDGLGPLFNRVSCSGCHVRDGRGQPPEYSGKPLLSMLMRLSMRTAEGRIVPHPVYGDQFQDQAILGVPAEGHVWIEWEQIRNEYPDGTPYTLVRPRIDFRELAYGPMGDVLISPRVAPAMIGLGLLEAVPEAELLAAADPDDRDADGISGRVNHVWDALSSARQVGRFGWKANTASLRAQITSAAAGDLGLTSSLVPQDACTAAQTICRAAATGGDPELSKPFVDKLLLYTQTLAVPIRRDIDVPEVRRGEQLFEAIGCTACHRPTFETGMHEIASLSRQEIHPFTDLLLHDLGDGLADDRPDGEANGREWRTPPLWGVGLVRQVNGHTRFLHDGRARNLEEAVLWHGGEAERSRATFMQLDPTQRAALLKFLESL